ncbi:hypothetical protein [Shewanella sp.]|uniref:hypothetical protein n=1 Tax=Shewanella sp. TaxID=50422 RepID=UPI001ECD545C|nr:hypothetical protein [Shewanella sp.]NRB23056.1 hypothetical protein [Shewanella sp.]
MTRPFYDIPVTTAFVNLTYYRACDTPDITQGFPTLTHRACDIPDITQAFPTLTLRDMENVLGCREHL